MSGHPPDVMDLLKNETAEHHRAAESHPFQRRLAIGKVSLEEFRLWLSQLLEVHAVLEGHLEDLRAGDARVRRVVQEHQFQRPYLEQDLAAIDDESPAREPLTDTFRLVEEIEQLAEAQPIALLGMHYVLEGSNNGSRFLARNLARTLGLTPQSGLRYMDPYGDRQPELWGKFKEVMRAERFSPEEREALLHGARAMFDGIARISQAMEASGAAVAASGTDID